MGLSDLGGAGAISVYGGFSLLILVATLLWYRCIWFRKYAGAETALK